MQAQPDSARMLEQGDKAMPHVLRVLPHVLRVSSMIAASMMLSTAFAQGAGLEAPGVLAAFLAGVISFLSPCVLPLVPSYLAVLGGGTGQKPVGGALLFILGFSLVFISFGASASALGSVLLSNKPLLARIGGGLILAFGVILLVKQWIPLLNREYRADMGNASRFGLVALGAAFAAGWTPCIGPILGLILSVAASSANVGLGVGLLAVYAAGLAIPFLLAALAWDRVSSGFRRIGRWVNIMEKVSGVVLIVVGILLVTDEFTRLNAVLQAATPEWLRALETSIK
jgi:cytochrome c-type biogenesis protein